MKAAFLWFWRDESPAAQRARKTVKLLVLLALLIALFWIVPFGDAIQALLVADPGLTMVGVFLGLIAAFLTAVEMTPLTRHQGIPHSVSEIFGINLAIKFYSQFSPTTLVGSGIRWYRLAQPGGKTAEALAAMAFFRVLETFVTLTVGAGFWLLSDQALVQVNIFWVAAVLLGVVVAWVLITRYSLQIFRFVTARTAIIQKQKYLQPLIHRLEKFLVAITVYASIPLKELLLAVLAGVASTLVGFVSSLFLARAVGIQIQFLDIGWIEAVLSLATQLPFAVAGGLGIREVTLVAILSTFDVPPELALAFSFLLLVRGLLLSLAGGAAEALGLFGAKRYSPMEPLPPAHHEMKES